MSDDWCGLRPLVRSVLDGNDALTDPTQVAAVVASKIPEDHVADALTEVLRPYVHDVMVQARQRHPSTSTGVRRGVSVRVDSVREGWQRRLKGREHVPDVGWKLFEDCSYDDLTAIAEYRQREAEQMAASGRWYRSIASLLTEHDVKRAGDLPADVLMQVLG
ncbi:hypothetical protein [Streptomyces sp. NPDC055085]